MLKVMIADGSAAARETLSRLVDWRSLGLELAGQCETGPEAWDWIRSNAPDIVLADAELPGLGGAVLAKLAAEANLCTQFILLSDCGRFQPAREAMRWGVRYYLLKPCLAGELSGSLKDLAQLCRRLRLAHRLAHRLAEQQALYRTAIGLCRKICALQTAPAKDCQEARNAALQELGSCLGRVTGLEWMLQMCCAVLLCFSGAGLCAPIEMAECLLRLQGCTDTGQLRQILMPALRSFLDRPSGACDAPDKTVARIRQYVSENLSNPDLTLKWIAERHLYMNVDYVSRKFMRETGRKFSGYLTEMRIQRAKVLLAGGKFDRIQWVAEQVGCGNNPQYFSQIFKKNTGMTPSAYAKMMRGQSQEEQRP